MNETKYIVPKSLDANNILDFLRMTEDVFKMYLERHNNQK